MSRPSKTVQSQDLYAIAQVVTRAGDVKDALEQITRLTRNRLIFDNLVIYHITSEPFDLEVLYARSLGRGKRVGEDIAWGEILAGKVIELKKTILEAPEITGHNERLQEPYMVGVPVTFQDQVLGSLIMIRFGGPVYHQEEISLIEFIASQIAILVQTVKLKQQAENFQHRFEQMLIQEDFISTISHELRNPLGFIKGYTTTLLRSDITWDKNTQAQFLNIIDQETDHLQELIENLLDSSRLQTRQMKMIFQLIRLDAVLNDVAMRMRLHHPELVLNLEFQTNTQPIQGDPKRLGQVFENIIANAIKYAPGSPVWVKIEQDDLNTRVEIRDMGNGIPEKYLPFIYDRFFRIPQKNTQVHGSGLGLFICKEIIQAHHGQLSASSEEGKGTMFSISLLNQS